jgi:Holliday junction resolvase RusA-like endonuclease
MSDPRDDTQDRDDDYRCVWCRGTGRVDLGFRTARCEDCGGTGRDSEPNDDNHIIFFVPGLPIAKGSAKGFYNKHLNRVMITQTNSDKQKPWASMISYTAQECGVTISDKAVFIGLLFQFPRPKKHFRANGQLRDDAPVHHCTKPDVDKTARCVFDALTGIAWRDDSQAHITEARKIYSDRPGVWVTIRQNLGGNND